MEKAPASAGVVFVLGVFLAGISSTACRQGPGPEGADREAPPEATAEAPKADDGPAEGVEEPAAKRRRARQPGELSKRIWWNQETVIETLALEEAQRLRMDEIFHAFVERDGILLERQQKVIEAFYTTLEAGDWASAKSALEKLADDRVEQVMDQPLMKIEVLQLLTPEQLSRFQVEYPNLFRQPWLRRTAMGSPRGQQVRGMIRERQAAPPLSDP